MSYTTENVRPADLLYQEAEFKTNRGNAHCLVVLAFIIIICEVLNEIGVFVIVPSVMRIGASCGAICYLTPVIALFKPLSLQKSKPEKIVYSPFHKYLIILFAWLGTAAACITLTHHTVIVMAIPIMIISQYRDTKKLIPLTIALATLCVLLGVYGGYFFGCFDANMLHMAITPENTFDLDMRLQMASSTRMTELLTHYALPRELVIIALIYLAAKISHRNNEMLDRQVMLQSAVENEMCKTNTIQRQIIDGMANLIENRDESTGEHVKRTSYYVKSIVDKLREDSSYAESLTESKASTIVRAAPLHDIGKIVVADRILFKPGRLTPEEYEEIKLHSAEGVRVIKNVLGNVEDEEFLNAATEIAGGHHERYDGKGYPNNLSGEDIPLSARIMAVADVFDALVSKRIYKSPIPPEEAFEIIESESGKQFDPLVVTAFLSLKPQILEFLKTSEKCVIN